MRSMRRHDNTFIDVSMTIISVGHAAQYFQ